MGRGRGRGGRRRGRISSSTIPPRNLQTLHRTTTPHRRYSRLDLNRCPMDPVRYDQEQEHWWRRHQNGNSNRDARGTRGSHAGVHQLQRDHGRLLHFEDYKNFLIDEDEKQFIQIRTIAIGMRNTTVNLFDGLTKQAETIFNFDSHDKQDNYAAFSMY